MEDRKPNLHLETTIRLRDGGPRQRMPRRPRALRRILAEAARGVEEADVFTRERLEQARLFAETVIPAFASVAGIELTPGMRMLREASPVHSDIQWAENTKIFLTSAREVETPEDAFDLLYSRTRDLADRKNPLRIEDMLIMLHAIFSFSFGQFRRLDDLQDFGSLQRLFEVLTRLYKDPDMNIDDFSAAVTPHLRQINLFYRRMRKDGIRPFPAPQDMARGKYS